jgi:glutamate racemase
MKRKAGMVHGVNTNVALFKAVAAEIMPEVDMVHLVDEGIPFLADAKSRPLAIRRMRTLSSFAEESGAQVVLITCTAFGRLVSEIQEAVKVPVLSVVEIAATEAVNLGNSIGVLGTHPGTITSASQIIREEALARGKKVEVKTRLSAEAFAALQRQDWDTHDKLVLKLLNDLMQEVKVVVIPQPSIERVLKQVPETGRKAIILPSVRLSVQRLKDKLDSLAG